MSDARKTTKTVVALAVQYGSALIIAGAAAAVAPTDKIHKKIAVGVAAAAIGGLVGEKAAEYTDRVIDEIWDAACKIRFF
jgi:hypothetical protein